MEKILSLIVQNSKRVLFLTQWFDPEPTFKGLVFARKLVMQGFDVEVVTGFPNYPDGKIYSGYKVKWLQREVKEGVQITRLPLYPSHDQSSIKRIFNYISFALSSLIYLLVFAKKSDVMYVYHPPLTIGITASIVKFFRRIPVVYDVQDMWPDTLRATGMLNNAFALRIVSALCHFVYRAVDHIVVLSPGFKNLLIQRGVADEKISLIYNWADEASLLSSASQVKDKVSDHNQFKILFAGNIGKAQALHTVLAAAELLQCKGSRVCWVMLGAGLELEKLKAETMQRQIKNVIFLPAVPMSEVGAYLREADALLIHLRQDPLFRITIPSKTQAYMAVGKPLLMAVDGDAAELVKKSSGGIVSESENPHRLAEAAQKLADSSDKDLALMGLNAKTFYEQHLSLDQGVMRFTEIFRALISSRS